MRGLPYKGPAVCLNTSIVISLGAADVELTVALVADALVVYEAEAARLQPIKPVAAEVPDVAIELDLFLKNKELAVMPMFMLLVASPLAGREPR